MQFKKRSRRTEEAWNEKRKGKDSYKTKLAEHLQYDYAKEVSKRLKTISRYGKGGWEAQHLDLKI